MQELEAETWSLLGESAEGNVGLDVVAEFGDSGHDGLLENRRRRDEIERSWPSDLRWRPGRDLRRGPSEGAISGVFEEERTEGEG